jgi:exodeoxyribonuclease VII small subunit
VSPGPTRFDPALVGAPGPLETLTFEQILSLLEDVTGRMASGDVGIEAATDLYEQAEVLHAAAQARLDAVEARINRLAPPSPGAGPTAT